MCVIAVRGSRKWIHRHRDGVVELTVYSSSAAMGVAVPSAVQSILLAQIVVKCQGRMPLHRAGPESRQSET